MMTPETFDVEGFQGLCETLTNAPHPFIVIAQVDPDAVVSAFALRFILQRRSVNLSHLLCVKRSTPTKQINP